MPAQIRFTAVAIVARQVTGGTVAEGGRTVVTHPLAGYHVAVQRAVTDVTACSLPATGGASNPLGARGVGGSGIVRARSRTRDTRRRT